MHAFDRQTDGQTDRNLIVKTALHSMQRGKNKKIAGLLFISHQPYSVKYTKLQNTILQAIEITVSSDVW